jgi:hypothetical protein
MFVPYPHIERVGKEDVEGIIAGDCYIFPKIDGTNASIWSEENGTRFGSRNREINEENDNHGFAAAMMQSIELCNFLIKNPTLRLYGEWLVPHTFKGYRPTAWRKFYVFDVGRLNENNELELIPYDEYKPILDEFGIEYIPAQKIIKNPSDEELSHELNNNFYLMDEQKIPGEGIVIKNYAYKNKWGRQVWAKMVRQEFKEANSKMFGTAAGGTSKVEEEIINKYITTTALCQKTYDKIMSPMVTDGAPVDKKKAIPRILETVYHELITEECWNFLKDNNMPTINFKLLRALCLLETKKLLPQLFL